jgi:hypothetical protein
MLNAATIETYLDDFRLKELFIEELGWEHPTLPPRPVRVEAEEFTLTQLAHKRGVGVFLCSPDCNGRVPVRSTLLQIDKEVNKIAHEHLLIFADAARTQLTWLWVFRASGQPTITRTHSWHKGQKCEGLRQKLSEIVWSLDAEEAITINDVIIGLKRAFDRDRVSKSFYDKFKQQHEVFAKFVIGLQNAADKGWYASLMLNRLMFVYFIQKKGFLDGDADYLANRLAQVQQQAGKGKFHTFYRQFLRRLFHEGLGQPKTERLPELASLIGNIPYLNGGLFDIHELEAANPNIDIPDEAFERLFAFFDAWNWHLDDRPMREGNEINPDVLGYIFEKFINQKQMGAYYTKEDITGYISKNTVIPHLLEQARERCKVAFEGEASVWNLLRERPDDYIYDAMKTGVIDANGAVVPETALPDFVQTGMKDAKARMFDKRYNLGEAEFTTATGERGTLPTETWREYVDRRQRCLAVREKLANGEVREIDDLITLNLDIRQFMQDVIDNASGPNLLRAIWKAIVGQVPEPNTNQKFRHGITILDPTCGSGAFLFAALNVLEPLYEACLDRMESFVEDAKKLGKEGEKDFVKVLAEVDKHPSRRYFIYKSIILHNLFGVDIMAEAVEICKLRLFLKLVSQVDAGRELEPLPDIDFNIRTGNTLVGYATEAQFDASGDLASDQQRKDKIKADIADLADLFDRFREQQTVQGGRVTAQDKGSIRGKLSALSLELDRYLARDYGVEPEKKKAFDAWRESHQPFHWFAEFYGVMREGGFDVVIGNPPYVETNKVTDYDLQGYKTISAGNLYANCVERSLEILNQKGRFGVIVPLSGFSTSRMNEYQNLLSNRFTFNCISFFSGDAHPSVLFDGVKYRLSIIVSGSSSKGTFSSCYLRWYAGERSILFPGKISYEFCQFKFGYLRFSKLGTQQATRVVSKLCSQKATVGKYLRKSGRGHVTYHRSPVFWIRSMNFEPYFKSPVKERSTDHLKDIYFDNQNIANVVGGIINSTLFYFWFTAQGNCRNITNDDIKSAPTAPLDATDLDEVVTHFEGLMIDLQNNSRRRVYEYKTGKVEYDEFYPSLSKASIDKIDLVLCKVYGFTDEETDFIINYDIKYRMGGTDDGE